MRNTSTIPQNIFIYGYSLRGLRFEQLMHLDTTIVSLFFQKKKSKRRRKKGLKKEREDIHNQSINCWCLTVFHVFQKGYMVE